MPASLRAPTLLFLFTLIAGACVAAPPLGDTDEGVLTGIEQILRDPPPSLVGRRLGLITNHTGIDRRGVSSIDRLARARSFNLVALFAPEHGLRGVAGPGDRVESGEDPRTGLPVHSLYGDTRSPTPEMLRGIDALLFDMQDVGARQYTYISTMALAMQAAARQGIPFFVLDRPNPVGGVIVEGGILDPDFSSFVGIYPIPSRHGMTVGELARFFNERFEIGANLTVIPMAGWRRVMWFDETGLPWVNPSPNIRSLEAAAHYPGTVYLEGTNLSEGRGTERPFEQTGAPWLRADEVVAALSAGHFPGVSFAAVTLQVAPDAAKYPGETIPGIRLQVTDRETYRPVETMLRMIAEIRRRHPEEFRWSGTMDRLAGTDRLRRAIEAGTLDALLREWEAEGAHFRMEREPYLLYR